MENILYEIPTKFEFDYFDFGFQLILLAFLLTVFIKCRNKEYKDTPYEVIKVISGICLCFLVVYNVIDIASSLDMHKKIAEELAKTDERMAGILQDYIDYREYVINNSVSMQKVEQQLGKWDSTIQIYNCTLLFRKEIPEETSYKEEDIIALKKFTEYLLSGKAVI